MTRESDVVRDILQRLGARADLRVWRNNTGAAPFRTNDGGKRYVRFGVVGQGDISGITHDGRRLEIEAKTETGRQSEQQRAFELMINKFQGLYILARSADDAERQLAEAGYPPPRGDA